MTAYSTTPFTSFCFQENTYKNISNYVHGDKVTPHFSEDELGKSSRVVFR
jgi:hypothetical protein